MTAIVLQVSCTRDKNRFIIVLVFLGFISYLYKIFKIAYYRKYRFNLSLL